MFWGREKRDELKSLSDLEEEFSIRRKPLRLTDLRRSVRCLVIDDENFAPMDILKNNGFNITRVEGISRIDEVEDYQVILVDLQGVGRGLNPTQQGAHIIRQVKKAYPEKYVIAYTGGATAELTSISVEFSDRYTTKDISIEKWCDILDAAVNEVADPVKLWSKFRHRLLDKGATPMQLAFLEDVYVQSFMSDRSKLSENLSHKAAEMNISGDVRNVLAGLIANAIFKLVVG